MATFKKFITIILVAIIDPLQAQTSVSFDRYFIDKTLRLDYFHTGTSDKEIYSYDEIFQEPLWAGSRKNLVDTLNMGKYLFKVYDIKTNALIYSRGFNSIFGEWQTIGEARNGVWRSFSESVRFPWPKNSVKVTIGTRDRANIFHDDWDFVIDPSRHNIRKTEHFPGADVNRLMHNGHPESKIDLVILPDGYTEEEMDKFRKDVKRLLDILFSVSPFKERKKDFNVWAVEAPSNQSGIDNPRTGKYVDNAFGCSFNAFDSDRYVLTWDNKTIRKAAARAPYDIIHIIFNDDKYGGGGIYNLWATGAADNEWQGYLFVHEFGHSFAGLGDEYYVSQVAYSEFYPPGVEPWGPNITALPDKSHIKWQDLMKSDTPLPTPWEKAEYETHQESYGETRRAMRERGAAPAQLDSLSKADSKWVRDFLRSQENWGKVGAYQGACYASEGLYRPYLDCIMFTKTLEGFCPVCQRAIETVIDFYIQ
jgi:hypothetical protein